MNYTPLKNTVILISFFWVMISFAQQGNVAVEITNNKNITNYIEAELSKIGLKPEVQQGYSLSRNGNLAMSKNVIAKIKGKKDDSSLLLIAHYNHSNISSNTNQGVKTVLQNIGNYLKNRKEKQRNAIIILFTPEGELGINGIRLFAFEHEIAKNVDLAINIQNTGVTDLSYLCDTDIADKLVNLGDRNSNYNSLIHRLRVKPHTNETAVSIFTRDDVAAFNLALKENYSPIDLELNNSKNVGAVLPDIISHFSNANLKTLEFSDYIYFTIPYAFIYYPASWTMNMFYIALFAFLVLLIVSKVTLSITFIETIKGFAFSFVLLTTTTLITFLGWKSITYIYPQYNDFTNNIFYNSTYYVVAFASLSLSMCFFMYKLIIRKKGDVNLYISPLFLWLLATFLFALFLKSASFFVIPLYLGLAALAVRLLTYKNYWWSNIICCLLVIILIIPFLTMLPESLLGMNSIVWTNILVVLTFGISLSTIDLIKNRFLASITLLLAAIVSFLLAHLNSDYREDRPKQNSLVYFQNAETKKSYWATYDENLDEWTEKYITKDTTNTADADTITTKNFSFKHFAKAPKKEIQYSLVQMYRDSSEKRKIPYKILIYPTPHTTRIDVLADKSTNIYSLMANGEQIHGKKNSFYLRNKNKVLTYYVYNHQPLEMTFSIDKTAKLDMYLVESSKELFSKKEFTPAKRNNWMKPKTSVLTDVVMVEQKMILKPLPKPKPRIIDSISNLAP